jgi:hypothetical protein
MVPEIFTNPAKRVKLERLRPILIGSISIDVIVFVGVLFSL